VDGRAKDNEATVPSEAAAMGALLAHLHGLGMRWSPRFDDPLEEESGEVTWAALASAGAQRDAPWAAALSQQLARIEDLARTARGLSDEARRSTRVASHRDLNAHNVLFTAAGLSLIDWDAAGPASPAWERASYATLWAARGGGRHDGEAVSAFLRAYLDAGGELSADDADTLAHLVLSVEDWTRKNVRWAVEAPTRRQDEAASSLLAALLATPAVVQERRRLVASALHGLLGTGP
jgi:Ser/Thr protein kinase RdoA (MazF antagonist)